MKSMLHNMKVLWLKLLVNPGWQRNKFFRTKKINYVINITLCFGTEKCSRCSSFLNLKTWLSEFAFLGTSKNFHCLLLNSIQIFLFDIETSITRKCTILFLGDLGRESAWLSKVYLDSTNFAKLSRSEL